MSPPDLNSLPPSSLSTTSTTNTTNTIHTTTSNTTAATTPNQPPTTPHRHTSLNARSTHSNDSGIIPFPRTMSMASQENNSPGGCSPGSSSHRGLSESPRLSITSSLQAAAAVNAGLRNEEDSRRSSVGSITRQRSTRSPHTTARRRSTVLMNLQLNDPALPGPGEMVNEPHLVSALSYGSMSNLGLGRASPRSMGSPIIPSREPSHNRAPSLGEIHQELEQEQEAQVNRLLQMIRVQQAQLQALQAANPNPTTSSAIEDLSPNMHPDTIASGAASQNVSPSASSSVIPATTSIPIPIRQSIHPRASFDGRSIRTSSRTPSRNASPGLPLRSPSIGPLPPTPQYPGVSGAMGRQASEEWFGGVSTRDEAQFYQAEAQMMTRENQMLRLRIRELEREVREKRDSEAGNGGMGAGGRRGSMSYEPATPSSLIRGVSANSGSNRDSGLGGSRQDRVSEMGQEDEEDASPRTTPAPRTPVAEKTTAADNGLARGEKE